MTAPAPFVVDGFDVGANQKGISRVIRSLVPELHELLGERLMVICTSEGRGEIAIPDQQVIMVKKVPQSLWEQTGLPHVSQRAGAAAIYSHRESGALLGPPLVLHVPEDPEVRWSRAPVKSARDRARRAYSRRLMGPALRSATIVGASVPSVAAGLRERYGLKDVRILPLGVDLDLFRPTTNPTKDFIFHLGSEDPRDQTLLVFHAYASVAKRLPDVPRLVLGGNIADGLRSHINRAADRLGLSDRVSIAGRLSDEALAQAYRDALLVVQPSSDEGFGLQPLEALASGAALLVTRTAAVMDVVGGGALVAEADVSGIERALFAALEQPSQLLDLRENATQIAGRYTWRAAAAAIMSSLQAAAESPSDRSSGSISADPAASDLALPGTSI